MSKRGMNLRIFLSSKLNDEVLLSRRQKVWEDYFQKVSIVWQSETEKISFFSKSV